MSLWNAQGKHAAFILDMTITSGHELGAQITGVLWVRTRTLKLGAQIKSLWGKGAQHVKTRSGRCSGHGRQCERQDDGRVDPALLNRGSSDDGREVHRCQCWGRISCWQFSRHDALPLTALSFPLCLLCFSLFFLNALLTLLSWRHRYFLVSNKC